MHEVLVFCRPHCTYLCSYRCVFDFLQVQLGGDRYSYLPDLAACPLLAAAIANALGGGAQKRGHPGLLWSGVHRLLRLVAVVVASGAALWACFLTTPGALLLWRSDESAFRHGLAIDPVSEPPERIDNFEDYRGDFLNRKNLGWHG